MTHSSFLRPCRHYVHTEAYRVVSFLPRLFSFYPVCQRARQKTLEFLLFSCFHLVSYAPAIPRSGRATGGSSTFSSLSIYLYTRLLLDGACIQPRRVCCVIPVIPYVNTRFELVMLNSKIWVSNFALGQVADAIFGRRAKIMRYISILGCQISKLVFCGMNTARLIVYQYAILLGTAQLRPVASSHKESCPVNLSVRQEE